MIGQIVIIGAGHAGVRFCEEVRGLGFAGRLVLIGEEARRPYERPPLSKAVLGGLASPDDNALLSADHQAELAIDWRGSRTAARIDRAARQLFTRDGTPIGYDHLVLATGVAPRRLDCPGTDLPGLFYLGDAESALRLRSALSGRRRSVVVIGGGFIGMEVAATATEQGHAVAVVEGAPGCLGRLFPASLARALTDLHVRRGVDIRTGASIVAIEGDHCARGIRLASGEFLSADVVVIGIGSRPRTELADGCGLEVANGVVVDAVGRTSDAAIFAIGDVAALRGPGSSPPQRCESWENAQATATRAAAAIMGTRPPMPAPPWFWTDQFGCNVQLIGLAATGCEEIAIDLRSGGGVHLYGRNGALEAVALVDAGRERRRMIKAVSLREPMADVAATFAAHSIQPTFQEG